MKNYPYLLLLVLTLILVSCTKDSKKEEPIVNYITSPGNIGSSLPYLYSNNSKTLLSWVEKVNDSLSKLKFTELVKGKWQEPKEIITGTDWFVNWADFPAIA